MFHHTPLIATLVAGFVLAFSLAFIAGKLRISPIVGYLVAGVIVGPYTPGIMADQNLANELAEMGIIFLMFGVGLHFSVKDLLAVKAIAIPGAIAQIGLATVLGYGMATVMGISFSGAIIFGLSLSVASTVVLLRALEERDILDTKKGRIAVGWLIVEDLAMVLALVLLPAFATIVNQQDQSGGDLGQMLSIVGITIGKVVAFAAVMLIVGVRVIPWILHQVIKTGSREVFTLSVLALSLGIAYGAAVIFGVSFALGAFLAGMVLAGSDLSHRAAEDSLPLRDAFAVLFFVSVGMLINPAIFVEHPLEILAAVLIVVVGKSLAAYGIVRMFGHTNEVALTISASLAQIGEFSFILVGLGVTLGLVDGVARDIVLAAAMVTIMLNPVLFAILDRWQESHQEVDEKESLISGGGDQPYCFIGRDHAVIFGYNKLARRIGMSLRQEKTDVVVLDPNLERVDAAREHGFQAVLGNGISDNALKAINLKDARCVLVATANAVEAAGLVSAIRALDKEIEIMAVALSDGDADLLAKNGANYVLNGEQKVADNLVRRVRLASSNELE